MPGGIFRWRVAMMVITGLSLVVVHLNMLPSLLNGMLETRALSNNPDTTSRDEHQVIAMKPEVKELKIPVNDLQEHIIHQEDHGNLQNTKGTRDDKQETAAEREDGLLVVHGEDYNNNAQPNTSIVNKKKYRGWVMMHTLKAGGNSVEQMLRTVGYHQRNNHSLYQHGCNGGYVYFEDAADDNRLWYEQYLAQWVDGKDAYFSALPRDEFFKIDMVREPCDYMVSIWAFSGKGKHGFLTGKCAGKKSKNNFTQFLHETSMPYRFGWLSYRVALQLGAARKENVGALTCPSKASAATIARIEALAGANNFTATESADCWVRTENILDDLRRCLQLYVSKRGSDETSMTIEKFPREKAPRANKGHHQSCSSYHSEEEARAVWEREGKFAEQFGYRGCCKGLSDPQPVSSDFCSCYFNNGICIYWKELNPC